MSVWYKTIFVDRLRLYQQATTQNIQTIPKQQQQQTSVYEESVTNTVTTSDHPSSSSIYYIHNNKCDKYIL
jgi:hypothetical protein